jgi:DNA-directed RNA polymerase subunit RPC12/RpoP
MKIIIQTHFFKKKGIVSMDKQPNQYSIFFRCPNCGRIFEKHIQKGVPAAGRGGECPNCGVKDGQVGIGRFDVVKENEPTKFTYNGPQILNE